MKRWPAWWTYLVGTAIGVPVGYLLGRWIGGLL